MKRTSVFFFVCSMVPLLIPSSSAHSQDIRKQYLQDRGTGVASSMFGTYIRKYDFIIYPYWEHYHDDNRLYTPEELGYNLDREFRGRYREHEYLFFLAYGLTDNLAVQTELAAAQASLTKSPDDPSARPSRIQESGLTSYEIQLRWRLVQETATRPEFWGYMDNVFPINKSAVLIGSNGFDFEWGAGVTRGLKWGTVTARASMIYETESGNLGAGEYAVEYLKKISQQWRLFGAIQGAGDELSLITEGQWYVTKRTFIRFNQEIGLSANATDWEPQLGILFTLPTR